MTVQYQLTSLEATYVVGAIRIALDHPNDSWKEQDKEIMTAIMHRLAAPMNLSPEVINEIER